MHKKSKYLMFILLCIITILFIYIQVRTDLALPDYMMKITRECNPKGDMSLILSNGLKMILITLLGVAATIVASFFASLVAAGISKDLRADVFEKVESYSLREFDKFSTASLITRNTNDIQQIQMFIFMALRMLSFAPIMAVLGIKKAVDLSKDLSWILTVSIPLTLLIIFSFMFVLVPLFKKVQNYIDRLNKVSRETLTGIRVIRAFRNEKIEEEKFDDANITLTKTNIKLNRIMVLLMPITMLILNIMQIAIVWFGAKNVGGNPYFYGNIMAFTGYSMLIMFSFIMISMISIILPRALVSWKRIHEVLKTNTTIENSDVAYVYSADSEDAQTSKESIDSIKFNNVSFSYPNATEKILDGIDFEAKKGEITAIIGSTGCGKSTLINLIPRFYDVTDGEILNNGRNVKDFDLKYLHDLIGYVPQKAVLFTGTVESNLKLGKDDATEDEIKIASQISQSEQFILEKEDGYNSEIAQGGTNVSGGQKQRLSIARALIKQPNIYIFDDSFSALDFKTDHTLREALKPYTKESITFIVAQRVTTIMNANQIIVLDDGVIVGKGTHKELLQSCEVYKEIASSQLSKEELE